MMQCRLCKGPVYSISEGVVIIEGCNVIAFEDGVAYFDRS